MGWSRYRVTASIAVADIARAVDFYEGKLGLAPGGTQSGESRLYACGGGTSLHVYESRAQGGGVTATLASWHVASVEAWFKDPDGNTFAVEEATAAS